MFESIFKWIRKIFNKFLHSIAFFPALMGIGFVILALIALELDDSGVGQALNRQVKWLTLKDPATARTIVSTITTGIISLTVFSFSMVMVVMNQAASQMSNRMLDSILGDRNQKITLSFYVGTIIYALFLLANISEAEQDKSAPSLSVYLLLAFTVFDMFLFVNFLHYITQSIKYEQLIQRIHKRTLKSFHKISTGYKGSTNKEEATIDNGEEMLAPESGYFQGFSSKQLMNFAVKNNITIQFLHSEGTYILKGTPFLVMRSGNKLKEEDLNKMFLDIDFYFSQEVDRNPYYGFKHLTEVGVKALSPGINDPGTAVLSLNALTDLLSEKMRHSIPFVLSDDRGQPRIITKEYSFEELFTYSVLPIWDYGKRDRLIRAAIIRMLHQLSFIDKEKKYSSLFDELKKDVDKNSPILSTE